MRDVLFSCDPGKMSGVALFDFTDGNVQKVWSDEWSEDQFYDRLSDMFEIYNDITAYNLEVVFENFFITVAGAKLNPGPWSLKYIGAAESYCTLNGIPFTLQTPSQKAFMPNEKMEAIGGLVEDQKVGAGHAYDAIRHGALYLVLRKQWRPEGLLEDNEEDEHTLSTE